MTLALGPGERNTCTVRFAMAFASGAIFAVIAACAPSMQAVYESDARFEHCYALDDSPKASMEQKGACWHDWVEHHTIGQTRDRIEYAQARYRAIEKAPEMPTDEAMMAAAPGEGRDTANVAAPLPTSAFAPPPKMQDDGVHAVPTPTESARPKPAPTTSVTPKNSPMPKAPGSECVEACTTSWDTCRADCGANVDKCDACESKHATCLSTCVKKLKASLPQTQTKAAKVR